MPWSRTAETSFLTTRPEMRDRTEAGMAWFADLQRARAASSGPPPTLGLHVAMGPDLQVMVPNLGRNLMEGRAGLIEAISLAGPKPGT